MLVDVGWNFGENGSLQDGFWPQTNYGTKYQVPTPDGDQDNRIPQQIQREIDEELQTRDEIFISDAAEQKLVNFVSLIDIKKDMMLLLRPSEDVKCQDCLWVCKSMDAMCRDETFDTMNKVLIQWWHGSSKASIIDKYSQCIKRDGAWEIDPRYTRTHWVATDA
ncbi:hypothetical protein R1flu_006572 [Riccia fluitans]|uniref:Uncharacterized protein n=1 Tax=Riccia fluitans TaxID=41844 RepID=A0ABD1YX41_9MARC